MNGINYWERVKHGCGKLNIPAATFYTWKHRGRVPGSQAIDLYEALQGTDYAVSLDELKNPAPTGKPKQNEEQAAAPTA